LTGFFTNAIPRNFSLYAQNIETPSNKEENPEENFARLLDHFERGALILSLE